MASVRRRLDPRYSPAPVPGASLFGLVLHALFQATAFRDGPVPITVTAPLVAVLAYARLRPEAGVRLLAGLAAWAIVGTGLALMGYILHAVSYRLPRSMSGSEMVLYDVGTFLWFVVALTAAYAVTARTYDGWRVAVAAGAGPLVQAAWLLLVIVLVETGAYA